MKKWLLFVNIMSADGLVPLGTKPSADTMLTEQKWNLDYIKGNSIFIMVDSNICPSVDLL